MAEITPDFPIETNSNKNQDDNVFFPEIKENSKKNKEKLEIVNILSKPVINPLWLTITEAAKIGGVQNKTVRRAILSQEIKYKIVGNKYLVDFASFVQYLCTTTKLKNKLNQNGIGQYIDIWRD